MSLSKAPLILYLLRHAVAEERSSLYPDDSLRPLSVKGRAKMIKNTEGIRSLDLSVDAVISSPYLRAKDTAKIAVRGFKNISAKIAYSSHLTPEASLTKLISELNSSYQDCKAILLVGHEPQLSSFVELLVGKESFPNIAFKKGGLCQLTMPIPIRPAAATLNWMKNPSALRSLI